MATTEALGSRRVKEGKFEKLLDSVHKQLLRIPETGVTNALIGGVRRLVEREHTKRFALSQLNTVSKHDHTDMPDDLETGCIAEITQQWFDVKKLRHTHIEALTNIFVSQWFDPELNGKGRQLMHGADIMFPLGHMFEKIKTGGEDIEEIEEVRFNRKTKTQLRIILTEDPYRIPEEYIPKKDKTNKTPNITARIRTNKRTLYAIAIPTEEPLKRRAASNTFVKDICAEPFTEFVADKKGIGDKVKLKPLSMMQMVRYSFMSMLGKTAMDSTTMMDIAITGTTALALTGAIPNKDSLGAGFTNTTLTNPDALLRGATFEITKVGAPKETPKSRIFPIGFIFRDQQGNEIAKGTFKWISYK